MTHNPSYVNHFRITEKTKNRILWLTSGGICGRIWEMRTRDKERILRRWGRKMGYDLKVESLDRNIVRIYFLDRNLLPGDGRTFYELDRKSAVDDMLQFVLWLSGINSPEELELKLSSMGF